MVGWGSLDGCGGGDDVAGGSGVDGDGAVGLEVGGEFFEVEVSVVGVAEQAEDFDVAVAVVDSPFVCGGGRGSVTLVRGRG